MLRGYGRFLEHTFLGQSIKANTAAQYNRWWVRAFEAAGGQKYAYSAVDRIGEFKEAQNKVYDEIRRLREKNDNLYNQLKNTTNEEKAKVIRDAIAKNEEAILQAYQNMPSRKQLIRGVARDILHAMNEGTGSQRLMKWGTVAAGWFALNSIGRAMTGGGFTYNSSGERDIAGIPFI